jgi:hypothetical protein
LSQIGALARMSSVQEIELPVGFDNGAL